MPWAYRNIVEYCHQHNIFHVYVFLPMTYERFKKDGSGEDINMAKSVGFTIIALRDVYDGHEPKSLIKFGKPPAMPGDSQWFDRSRGLHTLRSSTKSTKENRNERLPKSGTHEMGL